MASRAIVARNNLGNICRYHREETQVVDAQRELAAAKIADYVEKTLAAAPPLSDAQRDSIVSLLRAGGGM